MNLLIVDDEIFAIKGILDSVDWKMLQFDEVLTATGYSQAVNIMNQKTIAVLLCDIEMPMGNGIDLLTWVNEHSPETKCIILSCHDEFSFAQQALHLNCMDYLVKPAPPQQIEAALKKGQAAWLRQKEQNLYVDYGRRYVTASESPGCAEDDKKDGKKDPVADTENYIKAHLGDALSVEDLARRIYMNPEHLTRLFKKKYNKTLIEYITQERMTLAAEMLKHSDMTVSMISAKIGYPNYSYFTKIFKKYYGVTPREYQQE